MEGIRFVAAGSPEWDYMWERLASDPLNSDDAVPTQCFHDGACEAWQYMGTASMPVGWVHEFRHRAHPKTDKRETFRVKAQPDWAEGRTA
jgi:hypothetical protein